MMTEHKILASYIGARLPAKTTTMGALVTECTTLIHIQIELQMKRAFLLCVSSDTILRKDCNNIEWKDRKSVRIDRKVDINYTVSTCYYFD